MNILSLGIDVSGFSPQKKAVLNEFITLFEKLKQYDGLKVNPIAGDGLVSFNTSLKETTRLLDEIKTQLAQVKSGLAQVNSSASSGQGINVVMQKTTASTASATGAIKTFTRETNSASLSVEQLGRSLTKGLSLLRNIAYILPGVGLAGLFNYAFQGIEEVIRDMGYLGEAEKEVEERTKSLRKAVESLVEIFKELENNDFEYSRTLVKLEENFLSALKARGVEQGRLLEQERVLAKTRLDNTKIGRSDKPEENYRLAELSLKEQEIKVQKMTSGLDDLIREGIGNIFGNNLSRENFNKAVEERERNLKIEQRILNEQRTNLSEYNKAVIDESNARLAIDKFNSDQERKFVVDTNKDNLSVIVDTNKKIQADDKTTHEERLKSIEAEKVANIELARITRVNVTGTGAIYGDNKNPEDDNLNVSATPKEILIALNKQLDDKRKAISLADQQIERENVRFYQANLKAKTEIDKNELDEEAIKQEKISNNLNNSLEERLSAYTKYILLKQRIQEIEFEKDIQAGQSEKFGKGSLTGIQKDSLRSNRDTQQSNIQADVQKKVYDIVSTSLQKELKAIIDTNKLAENENSRAYASSLRALNDLYDKKLIRYSRYKRERKRIDEQYRVKGLDIDIKNDLEAIERIQNQRDRLLQSQKDAQVKTKKTGDELEFAKSANKNGDLSKEQLLLYQREYDEAVGNEEAINDAINKTDQELFEAKEKRDKDELAREKRNLEKRLSIINLFAELEKKIYEAVKQAGDQQYDDRIRKVEEYSDALQEAYDKQIAAVEKSSLDEKNKTALEIQLNEQKSEQRKADILEEKRLKREKAEFDKKISIAHIALATIEAVVEALTAGPVTGEVLAAERAAFGAAELAIAVATPIPSYFQETPEGGHPGGIARFGEVPEIVKEPYKPPYLVMNETIGWLPKGTEVTHAFDTPVFDNVKSDGWAQTKWLAKEMNKNNKEIKNIFKPTIIIGSRFENRRKQILGN